MRRREFIAALGAAAALPSAVRGQQKMPVVGFMRSTSLAASKNLIAAFRQGLKEAGFVEGENVAIEYRAADNQRERLPALAAELIDRPVAVIVGNAPSALAAKAATPTVPIVFATGSDPVADGLVTSLNRPDGNVTGVVFIAAALGAKRLELLGQLVPKAKTIGMIANPSSPTFKEERSDVEAAAHAMGLQLIVVNVRTVQDIDTALASFVRDRIDALLIGSGPFLFSNRRRLVALAARHSLPAMHIQREGVVAGGLVSYGASNRDAYRQAGIYAGRILKGEKPGDLPVMRSTKFELVINVKTAKALRLAIPPTLLAIADEVIE